MVQPDPVCPPLGLGGAGNAAFLTMAPLDRLLLYTDGLTEARHPKTGESYPDRRIIEPLAAAALVMDALTGLLDGVSTGAAEHCTSTSLISAQAGRNRSDPASISVVVA